MKVLFVFAMLFFAIGCTESTVSEPESLVLQTRNKEDFDNAIDKIANDKLIEFKLNQNEYSWKDLDAHYSQLSENYNGLALELMKVRTISSLFRDFNLADHAKDDNRALIKSILYLDEFTKLNGVQSDLVIEVMGKIGTHLTNDQKVKFVERTMLHNEKMIKSFEIGLSTIDSQGKKARMTVKEINKSKVFPISRIEELREDKLKLEELI